MHCKTQKRQQLLAKRQLQLPSPNRSSSSHNLSLQQPPTLPVVRILWDFVKFVFFPVLNLSGI
ncbi:hypothetical protein H5410_055117 [Solanum commersonii]|uniref:Uncharacterized protein n=1 Tax=Solanum commersonii TaxID=4109 RepID=A0A9J5WI45_SOLCO|nr:hypothetical protein H5410_055117 [Solanum commersonii]